MGFPFTGARPSDHDHLPANGRGIDPTLALYALGASTASRATPPASPDAVLLAYDWRHLAGVAVPLSFALPALNCLVAGTARPRLEENPD